MTGDRAFMRLTEKLGRESVTMSKSPTMSSYKMIHKVNPSLRNINKKEYEPFLVSIGPYHHERENLQEMEKYKVRMLQLLLVRTTNRVENYIGGMRKIEEEARAYYASDIKMDGDEFVEMMILDGCFILEFLRKVQGIIRDKSVFNMILLLPDIFRDLVLFENQMPLFVLSELFELTKDEKENFVDLIRVFVCHFCLHYIGEKQVPAVDGDQIKKSPHLLHLVYMTCRKCIFSEQTHEINIDEVGKKFDDDNARNFQFIKSATSLEETGVTFKKEKQDAKLCDITFAKNGVLKIPQLLITDRTESLFRNLVAYEQYIGEYDFTDYLVFMDYLINSPKDVELLRHCGIIVNMLGEDEYVSIMFNKICSFVVTKISTSKFVDLCKRINQYSSRRRNVWMAKLWRDYINSPWTLISFIAAFVLLGLTTIQTAFSIIAYENPK